MVSIRGLMPKWKPLGAFFLLAFMARWAATRAGAPYSVALALLILAIGLVKKTGIIRALPVVGAIPDVYELGLGLTLNEVMRGTLTWAGIPMFYKALVTGGAGGGAAVTGQASAITGVGV